MATGPAAGTTRGDEPPRLPGISQLQQAVAVAALLLMLPLLKGAAPKKGEPLPVSIPPPPLTPPPSPAPHPRCVPQESSIPKCLAYCHVTFMFVLLCLGRAESMLSFYKQPMNDNEVDILSKHVHQ